MTGFLKEDGAQKKIYNNLSIKRKSRISGRWPPPMCGRNSGQGAHFCFVFAAARHQFVRALCVQIKQIHNKSNYMLIVIY